jgi:hypothetical protein
MPSVRAICRRFAGSLRRSPWAIQLGLRASSRRFDALKHRGKTPARTRMRASSVAPARCGAFADERRNHCVLLPAPEFRRAKAVFLLRASCIQESAKTVG